MRLPPHKSRCGPSFKLNIELLSFHFCSSRNAISLRSVEKKTSSSASFSVFQLSSQGHSFKTKLDGQSSSSSLNHTIPGDGILSIEHLITANMLSLLVTVFMVHLAIYLINTIGASTIDNLVKPLSTKLLPTTFRC